MVGLQLPKEIQLIAQVKSELLTTGTKFIVHQAVVEFGDTGYNLLACVTFFSR